VACPRAGQTNAQRSRFRELHGDGSKVPGQLRVGQQFQICRAAFNAAQLLPAFVHKHGHRSRAAAFDAKQKPFARLMEPCRHWRHNSPSRLASKQQKSAAWSGNLKVSPHSL
jgi:hypothetical protein